MLTYASLQVATILSPQEWSALRLSFQVAACAALGGLPLAVALGYMLARSRFRAKWLAEAVINLPLVLPPVVTGYLLLVLLSPVGPLGSILRDWLGVEIVFTWWAAALAAAVVSFPLSVRAVRLAFQGVDPRLELAARSLGAGRLRAFFTVALPLARHGVLAGWMLAFARSLGEFGATIMVAGNIPGRTQTLALAIFHETQLGRDAHATRLAAVTVALAFAALWVTEWLVRRQGRKESA
jgi:molybdate transport system permease protein